MAVAPRAGAGTLLIWQPSPGYRTISLAGMAAYDLVAVRASYPVDGKLGPRGTDWTATGLDLWWKRLTDDDITAGSIVVDGQLTGISAYTGARSIGRTSQTNGVRLTEPGAGLYVYGWTPKHSGEDLDDVMDGMIGGDDTELVGRRQFVAHWFRAHTTTGNKYVARDDDAEGYRAFEILPAKAPNAPRLTGPTAGVNLDVAAGFALQFVHQSNGGAEQEGYQGRLRLIGAPTWQYATGTGTLTGTAATVASSEGVAGVNPGLLAAGTYEWSAATVDDGSLGDFAPPESFVLVGKPTSTPTLVTTPGDMTPTGSWTRTTPGGTQTAWRGVIAPAGAGPGAAIWSAGTNVGSGNTVVVTEDGWLDTPWAWINGAQYELWTQIQQTGGLWSDWTASAPQPVSWTPPATPASITPQQGSPFRLAIAGVSATSIRLEVQVLADVWQPLTDVIGPAASVLVDVPGAPYNIARAYRVRSWEIIDNVAVFSAWLVSAAVASLDMQAYFISVDGRDWLRVSVRGEDSATILQGVSVSQPMVGPDTDPADVAPMVDRTIPAGEQGRLTVQVASWPALDALKAWVTSRPAWDYKRTPERDGDDVLADAPTVRMGLADAAGHAKWRQTNIARRELTFGYVTQ